MEIGGNQQVHLHQICLQPGLFRDRQTNYLVHDFQYLEKKNYVRFHPEIGHGDVYSYQLDTRHTNIAAVNPRDSFHNSYLKMVSLGQNVGVLY